MIKLINNTLNFSFPEVHPEAKMKIDFQRTLRIPDDNKTYRLPPGLGKFPARQIDSISENKIPSAWKEHGGIMIPMFQSEALWINFTEHFIRNRSSSYPFAVRVATGKVSAVTGNAFVKTLKENDYVVVPGQPWLDGFVVEKGYVRQFVASPLGSGVSVEQQITGEDKVGGIQIEVIPMRNNIFNSKYPKQKPRDSVVFRGLTGVCGSGFECMEYERNYSHNPDMSLAAGGKLNQQIFEDKHGLDSWDTNNRSRIFIHLVNSMVWRQITGEDPPSIPFTSKEYTDKGFPWFDYYEEKPSLGATEKLSSIKSMKNMPGGSSMLPENESVEPKNIKDLSPKDPNQVREGSF